MCLFYSNVLVSFPSLLNTAYFIITINVLSLLFVLFCIILSDFQWYSLQAQWISGRRLQPGNPTEEQLLNPFEWICTLGRCCHGNTIIADPSHMLHTLFVKRVSKGVCCLIVQTDAALTFIWFISRLTGGGFWPTFHDLSCCTNK